MSIKPPLVRKRAANKLANTTFANELADAINSFSVDLPDPAPFTPGSSLVLARTTDGGPEGEEDFTNEGYWIRFMYVLSAGGEPTDANDDNGGDGGIAAATNVAERPAASLVGAGTHLLPVKTWVIAWQTQDDAGNVRWFFSHSPGRTSFWAAVTQPDSAVNKFAYAEKLVKSDGTWIDQPAGQLTGDGSTRFATNASGNVLPIGEVLITMGWDAATHTTTYTFQYFMMPHVLEAVTLSTDGGTEGNATTGATFTYTLTASDGNSYTTVSPAMHRIPVVASAAGNGIGILVTSGRTTTFHLIWCDEQPQIQHCGT